MINPGDLVTFYKDGWKTGYLVKSNGFSAMVKTIVPKGRKPKIIKLAADDLREIEKEKH